VELGGKLLPEGAHLLLMYASANDEPEIFPEPRRFDMDRTNIMKHVSFGGGVHKCVGIALARMEIKVAARQLVRRLSNFRLAIDENDIAFLPTVATRTMENCIAPGHIQTAMSSFEEGSAADNVTMLASEIEAIYLSNQPLKRRGLPEDVAQAALFLASDRSKFATGIVMPIEGGVTAGDPVNHLSDIMEARSRILGD